MEDDDRSIIDRLRDRLNDELPMTVSGPERRKLIELWAALSRELDVTTSENERLGQFYADVVATKPGNSAEKNLMALIDRCAILTDKLSRLRERNTQLMGVATRCVGPCQAGDVCRTGGTLCVPCAARAALDEKTYHQL